MEWSPQDAMEAYLDTLHHLSKGDCNGDDKARVIEPRCMELISAMAAGKGSKRILEITTQGITPLTIALAVAAKHTGGQLICILPSDHRHSSSITKTKLHTADLQRFIKVVYAGSTPCEDMKQITQLQLKKVDFAVIDSRFDDDYLKAVFRKLDGDVIKSGSTLIVDDVDGVGRGWVWMLGQVLRKRRLESATLPIGQGTEMTRVLGYSFKRRNRFLVTLHN
ncbi:hypothetical protein like AT2G45360 [Hibiscus trionum]|uniref:Uncharacterized protein n=1 Tax=Hibiscus trionum TaxID=183268 RepID=A0A9W7I3I2_HIBTR|nr:hypothetical protein like AT2G45360 [Hibiscus trionum]